MATAQDEAIQIFSEVIRDLTTADHDLTLILRRCQHACQLLDWQSQRDWFQRESSGYPTGIEVPWHRKVRGRLVWEPKGSISEQFRRIVEKDTYNLDWTDAEEQETTLEVIAGIDWLVAVCKTGYREVTSNTRDEWSPRNRRTFQLQLVRQFDAAAFAQSVAQIEQVTFNFASQSYASLRYGSALADIFSSYQKRVDAKLHGLGFENHFDAIRLGLQSDNPESWRQSVFECRSLLADVADYLWQDPRPAYEHLPGHSKTKKLEVTPDKPVNRLAAYLHQKAPRDKRGKFVRDELERLTTSIRSLHSLQSEAHGAVAFEETTSVALATYFILGEFVINTDFQPVTQYVSLERTSDTGNKSEENTNKPKS